MKLGVTKANIVVYLHAAMSNIDEENSTCSAQVSCSCHTICCPRWLIELLLSARSCSYSPKFQSSRTEFSQPNSELTSNIVSNLTLKAFLSLLPFFLYLSSQCPLFLRNFNVDQNWFCIPFSSVWIAHCSSFLSICRSCLPCSNLATTLAIIWQ